MRPDNAHLDGALESIERVFRPVLDAAEVVLRERPTMEHVLLLVFLGTGIYMYRGAADFSDAAAEFPRVMSGGVIVLSVLLLARNYLRVVAPFMAIFLGLYALYTGAGTYLEDGGGLLRIVVGLVLVVAGTVFREQVGRSTESFVAEPMQVLGKEDVTEGLPGSTETGEDADPGAVDETETDVAETEADEADVAETKVDETDVVEPKADVTETDESDDEPQSGAMYVYEIDDPRGPVVTGVLCVVYMLLTFSIGMLYATPLFVLAWAAWVRMGTLETVGLTALSFISAYLFYDLIQSDIAEGWLTGWEPTPPDVLVEEAVEFVGLDQLIEAIADLIGLSIGHIGVESAASATLDLLALGVTPA